MNQRNPEEISIFISYTNEDIKLFNKLVKHLAPIIKSGKYRIVLNYTDILRAGSEWQYEAAINLEKADIILLLISSTFMSSDYYLSEEMNRAFKKHYTGQARVIPVILRPIYWEIPPLDKLLPLPTNGKPVTKWSDRDEPFVNIVHGIERNLQELVQRRRNGTSENSIVEISSLLSRTLMKNTRLYFDACLICVKQEEFNTLKAALEAQSATLKALPRLDQGEPECYCTYIANSRGEQISLHISVQRLPGPEATNKHLKFLLDKYEMQFIALTGVCAGDKRTLRLGDLVVASRSFYYRDAEISKKGQMQQDIPTFINNIDWPLLYSISQRWERMLSRRTSGELHISTMAAVDRVRRDDPFGNIQELISEARALDMESAAFYDFMSKFSHIHSLVAKGVCDYANEDKSDDYVNDAAEISATYIIFFLKSYLTSDRNQNRYISSV